MASLTAPCPQLANCSVFHTVDSLLGPLVVFYRPHPPGAIIRIEAHVLGIAGFQSYPKLALNPSSPLYGVINHLPDPRPSSLHKGLAVATYKYFSELPKVVKETLLKENAARNYDSQAVAFDEMHAADVTTRYRQVESPTLIEDLTYALSERFVTAIDVDLVIRRADQVATTPQDVSDEVEQLLRCFGDPTHLPFSKLKRSLSRPASRIGPRKDRAEALERDLEELRYTEENFVAKMRELIQDIVAPMRTRSGHRRTDSGFLTPSEVDALFPPSLYEIFEANSRFLEDIRQGNIESFANACVRHFPAFKGPYVDYMRASVEFPNLLLKFSKNSSFSRRIQQTGEQKIRSLVIEPVQRLPRYSLLIDNMLKNLGPLSPAVEPLSNARSIIDEICSLQNSEKNDRSKTIQRLQSITNSWPQSYRPSGRLITAVDFVEVLPPYNDETAECFASVLLVFADSIAILRRPKNTSLQARGIMSEVDGSSPPPAPGQKKDTLGHDLQFSGWADMADIRFSGSDGGAAAWLTLAVPLKDSWDVRSGGAGVRKMILLNQYEGRCHKVEEEITKAKLERRSISQGPNKGIIGLREVRYGGLTIWSCIWGSQEVHASEPYKSSNTIFLDVGFRGSASRAGRSALAAEVGQSGVDVAMSIEESKGKMLRIECRSWNDYTSTDTVLPNEFLGVFSKRISSLLRLHASPQHPPLTMALLSANRKLLRALGVPFDPDGKFGKPKLPSSVKLFQNIIPSSPAKSKVGLLERTQSQLLPTRNLDRPTSLFNRGATILGIGDELAADPADETRARILLGEASPLKKLEQTFEAFIKIIRTMGSTDDEVDTLHNIESADWRTVDDFHSRLVDEPGSNHVLERVNICIVLSAFTKFLRQEWKDGMGAVISPERLSLLQHKSDTLYAGDFDIFFKRFMQEWTPQNQRAFRTLISTLKEMQEKMSREDSKGVLTKTFTELLVGENMNPLDFMGLVDRLVQDMVALFSGSYSSPPRPQLAESLLPNSSPVKRSKSVNTGVTTTGAMSMRKRFGLSHSSSVRETSTIETESSRPRSIFRTLSKRDKEQLKKHHKNHSLDMDSSENERPGSRDRPEVLGTFNNTSVTSINSNGSKTSNHLSSFFRTATPPPPIEEKRRKPKRRSSLGDLTSHPSFKPVLEPSRSPVSDVHDRAPPSDVESAPSLPPARHGHDNSSLRSNRSAQGTTFHARRNTTVAAARPTVSSLMPPPPRPQPQAGTPPVDVNNDLLGELRKIGLELSSSMKTAPSPSPSPRPPAHRQLPGTPTRSSSPALNSPADGVKIQNLVERVAAMERQVVAMKKETAAHEAAKLKAQSEARAARRKEEEYKKMAKYAEEENDVIFEEFNRQLLKLGQGIQASRGKEELDNVLEALRKEQGRLFKENMKLQVENLQLRIQMDDPPR